MGVVCGAFVGRDVVIIKIDWYNDIDKRNHKYAYNIIYVYAYVSKMSI